MLPAEVPACAICGRVRSREEDWFLMVESRWQDKIKILQWHELLATKPDVCHSCSPAHVQELVVHWMTTGSLDYPFARVQVKKERSGSSDLSRAWRDVDIADACQIGELAIHRESIERILRESPYSLTSILDALLSALERSQPPAKPVMPERREILCLEEQVVS